MKKMVSYCLALALILTSVSGAFGGGLRASAALPSENMFYSKALTVSLESSKFGDTYSNYFSTKWNGENEANPSPIICDDYYQLDFDVAFSGDMNPETVFWVDLVSSTTSYPFRYMAGVRYEQQTPGAVETVQNYLKDQYANTDPAGSHRYNDAAHPQNQNAATVLPGKTCHYTYVFAVQSPFINRVRMNLTGLTAGSVRVSNLNICALKGTKLESLHYNYYHGGDAHTFYYLVSEDSRTFVRAYAFNNIGYHNQETMYITGEPGADGSLYGLYVEGGHAYNISMDIRMPEGSTYHNTSATGGFDWGLYETGYIDYTGDLASPEFAAQFAAVSADLGQKLSLYDVNYGARNQEYVAYSPVLNGYRYVYAAAGTQTKSRRCDPSKLTTLKYVDLESGKATQSLTSSLGSAVGRENKLEFHTWQRATYSFYGFGQTLNEIANQIKNGFPDYYAVQQYLLDDNGKWMLNYQTDGTTLYKNNMLPAAENAYTAWALTFYSGDVVDMDQQQFTNTENLAELTVEVSGPGTARVAETEYTVGSSVTLSAVPDAAASFVGWYSQNGQLLSKDKNFSYTISEKRETVIAKFKTVTLTTSEMLNDAATWYTDDINNAETNQLGVGTGAQWATCRQTELKDEYIYPGETNGLQFYGNMYTVFSNILNVKPNTEYTISFDYYGYNATHSTDAVLYSVGAFAYENSTNWYDLADWNREGADPYYLTTNPNRIFGASYYYHDTYYGSVYRVGNCSKILNQSPKRWNHFTATFNSGDLSEILFYIIPKTDGTPGNVYFTNFSLSENQVITGSEGCAMRIKTENTRQGIRVKNSIETQTLQDLNIVEFGAIAAKNASTEGAPITVESEMVRKGVAYCESDGINVLYSDDGATKVFSTVLVGIEQKNYAERYVIRAYAKDGDGNYYYGDELRLSVFDIVYAILQQRCNETDIAAAYELINSSPAAQSAYDQWEPDNRFLYQRTTPDADSYDYSMAVIGDLQTTTYRYAEDLHYTFDWLVENKENKKLSYVFNVGDITDTNSAKEYQLIQREMDKLAAAGINQALARGNHDRAEFDQYINMERYGSMAEKAYQNTLRTYYRTVTVQGMKYMILVMDCSPTAAEVAWARSEVEAHPDYNVIMITHNYNKTNLYYTTGGSYSNASGGLTPGDSYSGQELFDHLVSPCSNIKMVICGHHFTSPQYRTVTRNDGSKVVEMIIDPQIMDANYEQGLGMLAMLYFSNGGKTVTLEWFSTKLNANFGKQYQFSFTVETVQ